MNPITARNVNYYMKRYLATAVLWFACIATVFASATDELARIRARIASAPSLEVAFSIATENKPVQGSAVICGDKYFMNTDALKVWYDGRTQWTFLNSSGEVSITEPEIDELIVSNPLAMLYAPADYFKIVSLPAEKGMSRVKLTPKKPVGGVKDIVLKINGKTSFPETITVNFDDDRAMQLTVDNISEGSAKPVSVFRYDAARFPAKEVIDLR